MQTSLEVEQQNRIMKILIQYLLFERKQETQLSMAFAILVQERHNQFHTIGDKKEGDGTSFTECSNELCVSSRAILNEGRSMAVEINDFTIQMIANYTLTVQKQGNSLIAYLKEKPEVQEPSLVTP